MSKSIFISCVLEDSQRIGAIKKWAVGGRLGDVVITHETEDKKRAGKEAIKKHLKTKIEAASLVMILIGQVGYTQDWLESTLELAESFEKEIICVRVPRTTGLIPPMLEKYKMVAFEPEALKKFTYLI